MGRAFGQVLPPGRGNGIPRTELSCRLVVTRVGGNGRDRLEDGVGDPY